MPCGSTMATERTQLKRFAYQSARFSGNSRNLAKARRAAVSSTLTRQRLKKCDAMIYDTNCVTLSVAV
jgi:hypothetical protein